jgi:hypothetical protein
MDEQTVRDAFDRLAKAADRQKIGRYEVAVLGFRAKLNDDEGEENGRFWPPQSDDENYLRIVVFRTHAQQPGDAWTELATLAHELGHATSFANGERPPGYAAATDTPREQWTTMPIDAKRLVYGEEERAWAHGREWLKRIGVDGEAEYDRRAAEALADYRRRLAMH